MFKENGSCGIGLTWTLKNGTLTISGKGEMPSFSCASDAHTWKIYAESIRTVIIDDGVTSIGENAFSGCTNLTRVSIPDSVTRIESAFNDCRELEDIFAEKFTDSGLEVCVGNFYRKLRGNGIELLFYFMASELGWKNITANGFLERQYTTCWGKCSQGELEVGDDYIRGAYVSIRFNSPNKNSFTLQSFRELLERFKTFFLHMGIDSKKEYIHEISEKLNITEFKL